MTAQQFTSFLLPIIACVALTFFTATTLLLFRVFRTNPQLLWLSPLLWTLPPILIPHQASNLSFIYLALLSCLGIHGAVKHRALLKELKSLKLPILSGVLAIALILFFHLNIKSAGPVANGNNDAFYYIPAAEWFSRSSPQTALSPNIERPSESVVRYFSSAGIFREGSSVISGLLLRLSRTVIAEASALQVVPAFHIFILGVLVCAAASLSLHFGFAPGIALLTTALFFISRQNQRLYLESFFPAQVGAAVIVLSYVVWPKDHRNRNVSLIAAFLSTALAVSLYPEALFATIPFCIAATRFNRNSLLAVLTGIFTALAVCAPAVLKFLRLLSAHSTLGQDYPFVAWAVPVKMFGVLGITGLEGSVAQLSWATWIPALIYLLWGLLTLRFARSKPAFAPLVIAAQLPMLALGFKALFAHNAYAAQRAFEFCIPLQVLLIGWLVTQTKVCWAKNKLVRPLIAVLVVVTVLFPWPGYRNLIKGFHASGLRPKPEDFTALEKIENNATPALIGATSDERSLFLSHFFLFELDQRLNGPYAWAQNRLSYFAENLPLHSPIETWRKATSVLLVSDRDCVNKTARTPTYIPAPKGKYYAPISKARFFRRELPAQYECGIEFEPGGQTYEIDFDLTGPSRVRLIESKLAENRVFRRVSK